jgi:hypothetical protein
VGHIAIHLDKNGQRLYHIHKRHLPGVRVANPDESPCDEDAPDISGGCIGVDAPCSKEGCMGVKDVGSHAGLNESC